MLSSETSCRWGHIACDSRLLLQACFGAVNGARGTGVAVQLGMALMCMPPCE